METSVKHKIGFWLSEKKKSKLRLDQVENLLNIKGYELVHIKNSEDFENKGPFLVIFHKLSDLNILLKKGDQDAEKVIKSFKKYLNDYPMTRILDPIEKIENLLDRNKQYQFVLESDLDKESFLIPNFIEIKTKNKEENIKLLKDSGVTFPFVCKPIVAHGCQLAHQMSLIFCEDGLDDIKTPCVAQAFINHSAKLYKLFSLKNKYFVVERPSLKNFEAGNFATINFDTSQISKTDSACELNKISKEDEIKLNDRKLDINRLDKIVETMRKCFDLVLFGVDVIIDDLTGKYVIIDINSFPAYDGVENFAELFCDLLVEEARISLMQIYFSKNYDQLLKEESFGFKDKIMEEKKKSHKNSSLNLPDDLIYIKTKPFQEWFVSQNENTLDFKGCEITEKVCKNNS